MPAYIKERLNGGLQGRLTELIREHQIAIGREASGRRLPRRRATALEPRYEAYSLLVSGGYTPSEAIAFIHAHFDSVAQIVLTTVIGRYYKR